MTMAFFFGRHRVTQRLPGQGLLLLAAGALLSFGTVQAQQTTHKPNPSPAARPMIAPTPPQPNLQFQQTVQQQQLRSELQKSQLQGQLQQNVSDVAKTPYSPTSSMYRQIDQADRARQDGDRARQRNLVDRYWGVPVPPPRVVPAKSKNPPAAAHRGD